ncbi:MAG: pilus assembly protein [Parahaliea sp.]
MNSQRMRALRWLSLLLVPLLGAASYWVGADDTEIYQSTYGSETGSRPKVLIVFDDSGSMRTTVQGQKPPYDPAGSYKIRVPEDRIYWSTNGEVPASNSASWFDAGSNRCAASFGSLNSSGSFIANRARRWQDSRTEQGQCRWYCPEGSVYRDLPGNNKDGCYQESSVSEPAAKLVYRQNDGSNNTCARGLVYVDPPGGNNDACYELVVSDNPVQGWVRIKSPTGNATCNQDTTYMRVGFSGNSGNIQAACYREYTEPYYTSTSHWQFSGKAGWLCEDETVIPGSWVGLSSSYNNPTHVECLNDVSDGNAENGAGVANGFPRNNVVNGNEYGTAVDSTIDWGSQAVGFFSGHYLNWYYDDSLIQDRSRMSIAQEVVSLLIANNTGVDFGLMEFNANVNSSTDGGRVVGRVLITDDNNTRTTHRNWLGTMVNSLTADGNTPLCESMYEAYRYLAGEKVLYGTEMGATRYDALPRDTQAEQGDSYKSPGTDCAYTYIILMTDGEPTQDTAANTYIETLTGKTCKNYGSKNCLPELAEYMANNDLDGDTTNGNQYGITYTIGFTTNQQLLSDTAAKGKGQYYTANNADELTKAFQGALVSILSKETTFTSPSVAVNSFTRTQSRNEVFYAMFKPGDTVDWIGNIKKLKIDSADQVKLVDANGATAIDPSTGYIKETAVTFWNTAADGGKVEMGGVGARLVARNPSTRKIYSNIGSAGALADFNATNLTAAAVGVADDASLWAIFGAATAEAFGQQVAWAQGYDSYSDNASLRTSARDWIMGDVLHSQPLVVNYGARVGYTKDNPDMRLLVGTNGGFVHMFSAGDGDEDWAFIPRELYSKLPLRRRNAVSSDNIYGMDLTPVTYTYDANNDGTLDSAAGDKVWAFFGMRRGGRSYYALDLSSPDSPSYLWRIGPDVEGFGELGQSWSEPVVTRIPGYNDADGNPKPVLIFGAGYDTSKDASGVATQDSEGRGIFIVDAQTGALVWSVTPAANSAKNLKEAGLVHSVPADVAVLDSNGDRLTDRIYFADTGGNLWRVDLGGGALPSATQDTWRITKLADFSGTSVDSDRRFFNAPDIVRIRFAGQPVDALIIGSGDRTNPNATDVDNWLYLVRDQAVLPYVTKRPTSTECVDAATADFRCTLPLKDSDLFDITSNVLVDGTVLEKAAAKSSLINAHGWRYAFQGFGEKGLSKSVTLDGKVYVTTFTPANLLETINVCEPQAGKGTLYSFDLYTGDREGSSMGPILPDTPSIYFGEDGSVHIVLPPGSPGGDDDSSPGLKRVEATLEPPYGNYWFQEEY